MRGGFGVVQAERGPDEQRPDLEVREVEAQGLAAGLGCAGPIRA